MLTTPLVQYLCRSSIFNMQERVNWAPLHLFCSIEWRGKLAVRTRRRNGGLHSRAFGRRATAAAFAAASNSHRRRFFGFGWRNPAPSGRLPFGVGVFACRGHASVTCPVVKLLCRWNSVEIEVSPRSDDATHPRYRIHKLCSTSRRP